MKSINSFRFFGKVKLVAVMLLLQVGIASAQKGDLASMDAVKGNPVAAFNWTTTNIIDMGKLEQNKPQTVVFEFVNTGTAPLVISKVEPSCGCTDVSYSKEPIAPKQKGFVKTTYNAASSGIFTKTITVFANSSEMRTVLTIKGEVTSKKS